MEIKAEDYLKYCLNRETFHYCSIYSRLFSLHIEKGRFGNVKEDERKWYFCNNDDIENEFHFLCVCNAYIEFRN